MEHSQQKYKVKGDKLRRHKDFVVSDEVTNHLKNKMFLIVTYSNLKMKKFGHLRS